MKKTVRTQTSTSDVLRAARKVFGPDVEVCWLEGNNPKLCVGNPEKYLLELRFSTCPDRLAAERLAVATLERFRVDLAFCASLKRVTFA